MNTKLTALALAAALSTVAAVPASAAVVAYNSLSAFNAAVVGASSHNFEGIAPANAYVSGGNFTVDGVNFAAVGGAGFVIDANAGYASYGASFFTAQNPSNVSVTLGGATAIGFFYGSYAGNGSDGTASLSTGDAFQFQMPAQSGVDLNFIGFVSDSDLLTSVSFSSSSLVLDFTQFVLARADVSNHVPEPTSLLLVGGALLGLGAARRRAAK